VSVIKELPGININTYMYTYKITHKNFRRFHVDSRRIFGTKLLYYDTTSYYHFNCSTSSHSSVTKICLSVTIPSGASYINVIEEPLQSSIHVLAEYPPSHTSIDEITTRHRRPWHKSSWRR